MFSESRRGGVVGVVLACALACIPAVVRAGEPTPRQAADALFREGRTEMERGNFAVACPLLARSQELDPAGGTLLNLALCHERAGHLVAALASWSTAAQRARVDGRPDREREALVHQVDLEGRVPRVTFVPPSTGEALVVTLDGAPLVISAVPVRIDPGSHSVRTALVGRAPIEHPFVLQERQSVTIPLEVPSAPAPATTPLVFTPEESLGPPRAAVPPPPAPHARFSIPSKVLFGVSAAVGLGAGITGALALSARLSYVSTCIDSRGYCTDQGATDAGSRARTLAWASTVTTGIAFAALWTALLLPRKVVLVPITTGRSGGLQLQGEF